MADDLVLEFGASGTGAAHCGAGWSFPETDGIWMVDAQSVVLLPRPAAEGDYLLELDLRALLGPGRERQLLTVEVGGAVLAEIVLPPVGVHYCLLPWAVIGAAPEVVLVLAHPDAWRPSELGGNTDDRALSFYLRSLRLSLLLPAEEALEAGGAQAGGAQAGGASGVEPSARRPSGMGQPGAGEPGVGPSGVGPSGVGPSGRASGAAGAGDGPGVRGAAGPSGWSPGRAGPFGRSGAAGAPGSGVSGSGVSGGTGSGGAGGAWEGRAGGGARDEGAAAGGPGQRSPREPGVFRGVFRGVEGRDQALVPVEPPRRVPWWRRLLEG